MNQRIAAIAGSILLFAGCLTSLYLVVAVTNAYLEGIFSTTVTDTPSNHFESFNCPFLLGRNETNKVSVLITNPTIGSLEYSVKIAADGFRVEPPAREQTVTLPGNQTATLVWIVTAVKAGNQAIVVQALSNDDSALPGPYHTWPTSFREGCGILVIDVPLTGAQVMWLSGISVLAGTATTFPWLSKRLRGRAKRTGSTARE
jgi:hypothetical protein